jgi:CheY-like chemotaxis protein
LAARDGVEVAKIYEREKGRTDVVVTDFMMPRLDEVRLVKLLACRDAVLLIIMISCSV